MPRTRTLVFAAVVIVGAAVIESVVALRRAPARAPAPALMSPVSVTGADTALVVPARAGRITIDGESDDPGWPKRAGRTGPFRARGGEIARPYSEARFVWGDDKLYVLLYAADQNIEAPVTEPDGPVSASDAFRLTFFAPDGERCIDVSALGVVSDAMRRDGGAYDRDWQSNVEVAHDVDGTPNVPGDDDEEWILELAFPLRALSFDAGPHARMHVAVERCDRVSGASRACATWSGELVLSPNAEE